MDLFDLATGKNLRAVFVMLRPRRGVTEPEATRQRTLLRPTGTIIAMTRYGRRCRAQEVRLRLKEAGMAKSW